MKDVVGLGLESSCDETSASVVRNGREVLSNIISSQIPLHQEFYGVVPEIASRAHLENVNTITAKALHEAGCSFHDLHYVSATNRPGLVGSLLIGLQSAKAAAFSLKIPLIAVNHLEGHLYAPFLEGNDVDYPYLGLIVSGGNTALYRIDGTGDMKLLGSTSDDAAGEAFDKVSKYFELGYPGGPIIEKLASQAVTKKNFLPKLLSGKHDYSFSYSGLKTAVINYMDNNPETPLEELAYSFQERALELLVRRVRLGVKETGLKTVVVAGGVAANGRLKEMLKASLGDDVSLLIPSPLLCTDNAAMIAGVAYQYYLREEFNSLDIDVSPRP